MEPWFGEERRVNCNDHKEFLVKTTQMSTMMTQIMETQKDIATRLLDLTREVGNLKHIVTNGMSDRIRETHAVTKTLCTKIEECQNLRNTMVQGFEGRLRPVEEFSWFREKITKIRNNFFWYVTMFFFLVVASLTAATLTKEMLLQALAKAVGL